MVAQKAVNVHMITARMDTMSAVAHLTDSGTTMLIITVIVQCLLLLVRGAVPSVEALRHQTHILILEFETLSPLQMPHDVTSTGMTEDDALIELIIIVEAGRLILLSQDIPPHNGPQDRLPKHPIPLNELLCPLEEDHDLNPAADPQVQTLSAAPAVQAVAVTQTAVQVMDHGHGPFSRRLRMHQLSLLWSLIRMSHVGALGLKYKTYRCDQQIQA